MGTGFDTIAYAFPVRSPDTLPGAILTLKAEEWSDHANVRSLRKLPSGGTLRSGIGGYGVVEVSARYGRDTNVRPLPWVEAVANVEASYKEAMDYVQPMGGFDQGRFVRVDACRDFDGGHGWAALASALEPSLRFPRARSRMYRDRARSNSLTLAIGNTGWRAAVYDKHAESYGAAPAGRLRYEYRQGKDWCKRLGVSLGSCGQTQARARSLFDECRFSAKVVGMDAVLSEVLQSSGLSPTVQLRLLGWIFAESRRVDLGMSRDTRRKYERLARELGIVPASAAEAVTIARLDYESGTMELEAA